MNPLDFLLTQSAHQPEYLPELFPTPKPVGTIDDDRFLAELTAATQQMNSLSTTISQLFHYLHERLARESLVATTHETWRAQSESATQSLVKLHVDTRSSYKKIGGMQNLEKAAAALEKITFFEHEISALIEKGRETSLLLASSKHETALIEYKQQIKSAKVITPDETAAEELTYTLSQPECQFRAGSYFTSISYRSVMDQAYRLQTIMRDILALQKQYRDGLLGEQPESIEAKIKAIETRIEAQQKSFTHHSLWYYREALLAELSQAKSATARYLTVKKELAAVLTLKKCLHTLSCTQEELKSFQTLKVTSKIGKVVKRAIAQLGKQLLAFNSKEDLDYVKNRMLYYLYFERNVDPELDYLLRDTREDDELLRLYKRMRNCHAYGCELIHFIQAVEALRKEAKDKIDCIINYYKADQLLQDLKKTKLPQEHLIWLEKELRSYSEKNDELLNLEDEFSKSTSKVLFKPLISALFSTCETTKTNAVAELMRITQQDGFLTPFPETIIGRLYALWKT